MSAPASTSVGKEPTVRFSNRAEDYVKYRPNYPSDIVSTLEKECGLDSKKHTVVDIGAGTGISTELFLKFGYKVIAVEPNLEMRLQAEKFLSATYPTTFTSKKGTAEATEFPDSSVDFIIAAQAFHWFNIEKTRIEFERILKPEGQIALFWNERIVAKTPEPETSIATSTSFGSAYDAILQKYCPEFKKVTHTNLTEQDYNLFFAGDAKQKTWQWREFGNDQQMDFDSIRGRMQSSSYGLLPGDKGYDDMISELQTAFDRFQRNGKVTFHYKTRLYFGNLK